MPVRHDVTLEGNVVRGVAPQIVSTGPALSTTPPACSARRRIHPIVGNSLVSEREPDDRPLDCILSMS